jgi:3-oxoacyl-[acyl-carrier protein] reductase
MRLDLSNKVALVTGGSRGIGAATARALAQAGATVAVSYAASADKAEALARELEASGHRTSAFRADQGDPAQVEDLIRAVVSRFGRLDILVNNAGVFVTGLVGEVTDEAYERQFGINVRGVFAAVRAAAGVMGDGGRIVSVASVLGDRVPFPGSSAYGATKAAVSAFTKGWARDLASRGITVNAVQPGPIDTDMNPAGQRLRRRAPARHGARALRPAGGGRGGDCLSRQPRRLLHHGDDPGRGRRLQRLSLTAPGCGS